MSHNIKPSRHNEVDNEFNYKTLIYKLGLAIIQNAFILQRKQLIGLSWKGIGVKVHKVLCPV